MTTPDVQHQRRHPKHHLRPTFPPRPTRSSLLSSRTQSTRGRHPRRQPPCPHRHLPRPISPVLVSSSSRSFFLCAPALQARLSCSSVTHSAARSHPSSTGTPNYLQKKNQFLWSLGNLAHLLGQPPPAPPVYLLPHAGPGNRPRERRQTRALPERLSRAEPARSDAGGTGGAAL